MSYSPIVNINLKTIPEVQSFENIPVTIIAPKLASGTATAGVLLTNPSVDSVNTLFGAGSVASQQVKKFRAVNPNQTLYVFPVDDPAGGVEGTATQVMSGTATNSGLFQITIDGKVYSANFVTSDTAESVFDSIRSAISADSESIVVGSGTTDLVLTHKHKGVFTNNTTVQVEIRNSNNELDNSGFTFAGPVGFSLGAGLPVLTTLFSELANIQSHILVDYNIIKDGVLGISLIDNMITRKIADNRLRAGKIFFVVTDDDTTYSTFKATNVKYSNSILCPIVSKRVSTSLIVGDYNNNATYNLSSLFTATLLAYYNKKVDIRSILSGQFRGNIANLGNNLSGLKIPTALYNANVKGELTIDDELPTWSTLGVTAVRTIGTSLEIANEGYTSSLDITEKYLATDLIQFYIQQLLFIKLKGPAFQNKKSTLSLRLLVSDTVKDILNVNSGDTIAILNKDKLKYMTDSIIVDVDPANPAKLLLSFTVAPNVPFVGIDVDISFNVNLSA